MAVKQKKNIKKITHNDMKINIDTFSIRFRTEHISAKENTQQKRK